MSEHWDKVASRIEADAIEDLRGHKRLQSPEGQRFVHELEQLRGMAGGERFDPLLPWLAREFRKGRLIHWPGVGRLPEYWDRFPKDFPHSQRSIEDQNPGLLYPNPRSIYPDRLHYGLMNHWADWYHSPERRQVPLEQVKIGDMPGEVRAWEKAMADKATAEAHMPHAPEGKVVHQYPDGWTVRELPSSALPFEGWAMRGKPDPQTGLEYPICVGDEHYQNAVDKGQVMIHSLRDPNHMPHVTMEIRPTRTAERPPFDLDHEMANHSVLRHVPPELRDAIHYYEANGAPPPGQVGPLTQPDVDPNEIALGTHVWPAWAKPDDIASLHGILKRQWEQRDLPPIPDAGTISQIQGKGNSIPKPEYQQRMKQWFQTFPEETRPNWAGSPIKHVAELNPDHPEHEQYVDEPDEDEGGYSRHGDYGLAPQPIDYNKVVDSLERQQHDGSIDWDHDDIDALYRAARRRGEIPDLGDALYNYRDHRAYPDLDDLRDKNWESMPDYPGESWDEDPERWQEIVNASLNNEFEWGDPYRDVETPEEAFKVAQDNYTYGENELRRQHPPSQILDALQEKLQPHFHPQGWANTEEGPKSSGYYNQIYDPSMGTLNPQQLEAYLNPPPAGSPAPALGNDASVRLAAYNPILDMPREEYEKPYPWENRVDDWDAPEYQAYRQRRDEWRREMRRAIALGHIDPNEALARGYNPTGHDSGRGLIGDPKHGWLPLPQELYHVTTDLPSVLQYGLKTRAELGQERGKGLGGGEDDTISFTTNPELARHVHDAIRNGISVARGEITPQQLIDMARAGEGAERPWWPDLRGTYAPRGDEEYPLRIRDLLADKRRWPASGEDSWLDMHTPEEWAAKGWEPDEFSYAMAGVDKATGEPVTRYTQPVRPLTPEERQEQTFDLYKSWLAYRQFAGGPENPMFFLSDVPGLAATDPAHVGILRVTPKPGAMGYPTAGMNEWRVPTGEGVTVAPWEDTPARTAKLATQLYKRWVFSPATGKVEVADNSEHPLRVKYHQDLASRLNEPGLVHGYAYKIGNGWRLTDWDSQPLDDHFVIAQVMRALENPTASSSSQWEDDDDEGWDRMHHGIPPTKFRLGLDFSH